MRGSMKSGCALGMIRKAAFENPGGRSAGQLLVLCEFFFKFFFVKIDSAFAGQLFSQLQRETVSLKQIKSVFASKTSPPPPLPHFGGRNFPAPIPSPLWGGNKGGGVLCNKIFKLSQSFCQSFSKLYVFFRDRADYFLLMTFEVGINFLVHINHDRRNLRAKFPFNFQRLAVSNRATN